MEKMVYYIAIFVGSSLGSYLPTLFGAGFLSLWSVVGGAVGGFLFIYLAYKFVTY